MEKAKNYELLAPQVESLAGGYSDEIAVMANVCAALRETMGYFWVGFYRVSGTELVLGPFQGSVACFKIPYGKGVCGTAWQRRETIVVEDVEQFPGHIACSSLSRSEIVVPLCDKAGEVRAVLDIDSTDLGDFDDTDRQWLEQMMKAVARQLYS
jgi:GAF domain-containing protein